MIDREGDRIEISNHYRANCFYTSFSFSWNGSKNGCVSSAASIHDWSHFLFIGLQLKWIKLKWVETGAAWLLAELLLFFIPSAVGIVNYEEILNMKGIETVLLIAVSTFIVMGATGFTAEKIYNRKRSLNK